MMVMNPPDLAQLKRQCHQLIEVVSHRPGALKLMLGIHQQLQIFSAYKMNRKGKFQK